jgi:DNA-binding PadR family transcriptional regulator
MAKRRKVANPLALAVLAWLVMEPMHPYELGRRLQETGQDKQIKYNRSSLYMVMEQLAKAGFIAAQQTVRDTQRPERTVYALTDAGRSELYDWMRELVAEPRHEYPHFGVALSLLSVLAPLEAAELLTRRRSVLDAEIDATRSAMADATAGGLAWVFQIEDDYRLTLLAAESRFVAGLITALRDPDHLQQWQETMGQKSFGGQEK